MIALEDFFGTLADAIALGVELAAVVLVGIGALDAARRIAAFLKGPTSHGQRKEVWRRFGMWLLLALEFELAADIVRSVIAPSWLEIGQLGAIAVIRTFLNYFLEQDLEAHDRAVEAARMEPVRIAGVSTEPTVSER